MKSHANIFFGDEELLKREKELGVTAQIGGPLYRERNLYEI